MATANVKAVITAEDRSGAVLAGFGAKIDSMGESIVRTAKRGIVAFGAAAVAATSFAVKSASDFEQTRIGLENMLGSADTARALLSKISKFAAETPFEFPELAQATRQLVAFGFSADEAFKTMTELGDVSAAIGAPINDLAYLMGTLRTQGRAFTVDIRQFAQRGVPIYEYLAKVLKTNEKSISEMIEKGKIGFPEVQKAFQMMTAEGGKFHNTMAKQSKSLSGLFSTLKDVIGQTARELVGITQEGEVKQGSIFDKIRQGTAWLIENLPKGIQVSKNAINDFLPTLTQWKNNTIEVGQQVAEYLSPKLLALWNTIGTQLMPLLERLWREVLLPLAPVIGTLLVGAVGLLVDGLNFLLNILTPIGNWLIENKEYVLAFAAAFGTLYASIQIWDAIDKMRVGFETLRLITIPNMQASLGNFIAFATGAGGFALIAAAAVGAAVAIGIEWRKAQDAIESTQRSIDSLKSSNEDARKKIQEAMDQGKISIEKGQKALQSLDSDLKTTTQTSAWKEFVKVWGSGDLTKVLPKIFGRASGGPVDASTPYIVGEQGPELFVPRNSGNIIPNGETQKIVGSGGRADNIHITINAGALMGNQMEARKFAEKIMQAWQDAQAAKGVVTT